ncbi:MAG: putative ABC transporter permease [Ruminococcus sp.]|nr:putative ABC transporter permease [Ruminococcus sp.]
MNLFLILTFLFAVGGVSGWVLEVFYRRFVSQKHWVDPGFLTGPCLPLYGEALCILYLLAQLEEHLPIQDTALRKLLLFVIMAAAVTLLEFAVGAIMIRTTHVRLWDYSDRPGNIMGIICPLYSFFWMLLSAAYYFLIHPHILEALEWLSRNLAFSFGIGFFYGVFVIDFAYSAQIIIKIRRFADEKQIVVRLEELRETINYELAQRKPHFIFSLRTEQPFREALDRYHERYEELRRRIKRR